MICDFVSEPTGALYRQVLEFCAKYCDQAALVVREVDWLNPEALDLMERLRAFQLSVTETSEWPGTKLLTDTATVYRYSADGALVHLLEESARGLYDWVQPERPEDLTFFRPNGNAFLVTIAHERDGYLDLTPAEFDELAIQAPGLAGITTIRRLKVGKVIWMSYDPRATKSGVA
jgi:hypothetical protein